MTAEREVHRRVSTPTANQNGQAPVHGPPATARRMTDTDAGDVTMQRRGIRITALFSVLLLGLFAAPAAAQQAGDTVDLEPPVMVEGEAIEGVTALQCAVGVAQANADMNPDAFADTFAVFFLDFDDDELGGVGEVADGQEQALVDATVDFLAERGQTLADVCSIYIVDVLPDVVDEEDEVEPDPEPEPDTPDPDPEPEPTVEIEEEPAEVLGVSLQRTGIDALLMAVIGVGLLGLGVLAVRRTRDEIS